MPKFRVLAKVYQYEEWFVDAGSEEDAKNGIFEVWDTEGGDQFQDAEIVEVDPWGDDAQEDDEDG